MKRYFILYSLIFILFTGCQTQKNLTKSQLLYKRGLQHTKVTKINNNQTTTIINVTYLNPIKSRWDNKYYNFIIGIKTAKQNILDNTKLTLNQTKPKIIKSIDAKDKLYKTIPLKNPWAKYYLVSFEKNDNSSLVLQYDKNNIF